MIDKKELTLHITNIVQETNLYDFPFRANEAMKQQIINEKKFYIEDKLKMLSSGYWPDDRNLNQMWNESITWTNRQFASLPSQIRINGFYLQELMHHYAKLLGEFILSKIEVEK